MLNPPLLPMSGHTYNPPTLTSSALSNSLGLSRRSRTAAKADGGTLDVRLIRTLRSLAHFGGGSCGSAMTADVPNSRSIVVAETLPRINGFSVRSADLVDAQDHIWVNQRPGTLDAREKRDRPLPT